MAENVCSRKWSFPVLPGGRVDGRPQGGAVGEELGAHHAAAHRRVVAHQFDRFRLGTRREDDDPEGAFVGILNPAVKTTPCPTSF
jgi:hypothetical protein